MTNGAARLAIIPKPERALVRPGSFRLEAGTTIAAGAGALRAARLLHELLAPPTGIELPVVGLAGGAPATATSAAAGVTLALEPARAGRGAEWYRIVVTDGAGTDGAATAGGSSGGPAGGSSGGPAGGSSGGPAGVHLRSSDEPGLLHAVQTVLQLLAPDVYRRAQARPAPAWELPCVDIEDSPRFAWRGAHLDVARHFMPPAFLRRYVDLLAMHRMNVLHLHLTDDQGWRFPSSRYPRLVEVGCWRRESMLGHHADGKFDGTPHGGAYSKRDLEELVEYAGARGVTLVPEIDFPGHTQAAIAAYPELGNTGAAVEVATRWGISEHVLNASEEALGFCKDVLAEVTEIFPGRYVHVGGDECPTTEWLASPAAGERARALGLASAADLQGWFTTELGRFLAERGRNLVGWDEILDVGKPPAGSTVMVWRDEERGRLAAERGHDVVMAPERCCYLDRYQSDDPGEPLALRGHTTLADVLSFEPVPADLEPEQTDRFVGVECAAWTEYMPTPEAVEYMAFPRACAFAEVAWARDASSYDDFISRLGPHLARLDALGVNYRPLEGPRPWQRGGTGARARPVPPERSAAAGSEPS